MGFGIFSAEELFRPFSSQILDRVQVRVPATIATPWTSLTAPDGKDAVLGLQSCLARKVQGCYQVDTEAYPRLRRRPPGRPHPWFVAYTVPSCTREQAPDLADRERQAHDLLPKPVVLAEEIKGHGLQSAVALRCGATFRRNRESDAQLGTRTTMEDRRRTLLVFQYSHRIFTMSSRYLCWGVSRIRL